MDTSHLVNIDNLIPWWKEKFRSQETIGRVRPGAAN